MQEITNTYGTSSKSQNWILEIQQKLNCLSPGTSYQLLKAVLQSLRDQMNIAEMAYFAAQLPLLLRGTFFEGWNPHIINLSVFTKDDFLESVRKNLGCNENPQFELETGVLVALNVIKNHLSGDLKENHYVSISDNLS